MADDEQRQDEETQPEAEQPEAEQPEAEAQNGEDQETEGKPAEEHPPDQQPEEEASPGDSAEEAPPEEAPAAEEEAPAEAPAADGGGKKEKKPEVVPGAELDPIAIEPDRPLSAEEQARQEAEAEERASRERELIGETPEEQPVAAKPAKLSGDVRFLATGKRKSSVARVVLTPGRGSIQVNKRQLDEYFPRPYLQTVAKQPLVQTGYEGNVDIKVRVHGGGVSGQASAVRHGIARALIEVDPELRGELKKRGMLTRDSRVKERRKAGLKKARKKPQFSKR